MVESSILRVELISDGTVSQEGCRSGRFKVPLPGTAVPDHRSRSESVEDTRYMTAGTRPSTFAELFMPKLITVLREGYGVADFKADAVAGLTVAIVALPLSMAIAIASGVAPDRGLYTAIVGGFLVSALGGRDRPGRHRLPDLGRVLLRGGCRGRRRARPPQRTPQGLCP